MPDFRSDELAKAVFVLGFGFLVFLYGYGAHAFGWFPSSLVERAYNQARALDLFQSPDFGTTRVYKRSGVRWVDKDATGSGLILISSVWEDFGWTAGLRLMDRDGRVLHEWQVDPTQLFGESANRRGIDLVDLFVHGSHLFPDGDVLVNVDYVGTARLDACGDVEWRLPTGSHHSIDRGDAGAFWIGAATHLRTPTSPRHPDGLPGLKEPVYEDLILRVTEDGTVTDTIEVLDVLYENGLEHHLARQGQTSSRDPTHLNDVEPLPVSMADKYAAFEAGDLLVSLKGVNLVLILDPRTEEVKWHTSRPFIGQHDPDFMEDGWIGVFDNRVDGTDRGRMLGGSRIVALNPDMDSTSVIVSANDTGPFYTEYGGKWQRLDDGNLLLTETDAGRVLEVEQDGTLVWEWVAEPYDESTVTEVYEATMYDVSEEDVENWPCSVND